jgi:hypothetical protein
VKPLGKHQLRTLVALASPLRLMVVEDAHTRALASRGLARNLAAGGMVRITPAGLRQMADELESDRLDQLFPTDIVKMKEASSS